MEASPLQQERAECLYDISEARRVWMGEKAVSAFANFKPIDDLLDELLDIDRALQHYPDTDYKSVKQIAPAQGYESE